MELIIIDLTNLPDAAVGDEVVCWGKTPSIDEVATAAGRVSYELFTAAGRG
jgi:alanine racemase